MNRYEILERLGDGSFGEVVKARSIKTHEIVAIKKIKALFPTWEECLQLRELKSLRVLRHDNVVQLKEVIRDKEELYFVFEYMQSSLHKVMRQLRHACASGSAAASAMEDDDVPSASSSSTSSSSSSSTTSSSSMPIGWFSEAQVKSIMFQLFSGLAYMHKHGFFHRDIKPENLLCHDDTLKIADLGQAREIRSRPPFTDYVATRWYRSPELLLRATAYNSPIDLWACGCIMAELYLQTPLFAGTSEADQLYRICKVLGTPTKDNWPEGVTTVAQMQFKFPKCPPVPWKHVLPAYASKTAVQLISELLQYDPSRRLTAAQALQHRFFDQQVTRPLLTSPVQHVAAAAAVVPVSAAMLLGVPPLKAEHKGGGAGRGIAHGHGAAATKKLGENEPDVGQTCTTSRWWKESAATLPSVASHGDVLASSRRPPPAFDVGSSSTAAWSGWDKPPPPGVGTSTRSCAIDDRADAKIAVLSGGAAGGGGNVRHGQASKKHDSSGTDVSSSSWLSARKWTSPEEDGDGDDAMSSCRIRADDGSAQDKCLTRPSGGGGRGHKSQDHMLQDLLDEFLA